MDRIYTGFESLDSNIELYKGDLIVIGGLPAVGKTCFMYSIIEQTLNKQKSLFFTMQTNKHKAIERLKLLEDKQNFNFCLFNRFVDYGELVLLVAEYKIKQDIDVVFIDNAVDFFACSYYQENELTLKLKELAQRLNVAIIIADNHVLTRKKLSCYIDLRHKSLIKYGDKIISINRPDKRATELELKNGWVKKYVAVIRVDKDIENYFSPQINLKFDNISLTFNEF